MKNFKRVISAVIALALSVSSFAAVSASSFTDVADTAAYAEAVEVLSALGIVPGYTDGTFKPEGEITRAEAATMIVGAMNLTEDAKAAAGTSQFADVNTQANWATGYVNVGVAQGFISGMGDGSFAPQSNVTYAQMCVMLTSITGYGEYASKNGGYPTGYTSMAAQVGINSGVSVAAETNLTRGQVAQMIYNALTTPMLGVTTYTVTGNEYSQLDGKDDRAFKTLLSDKFNGYVVTADITATSKTNNALDNGYAYLTVTKADQWDDTIVQNTTKYPAIANVKVDATAIDADANLFQSGKGVITIDDNDDNHLIYFAASGKTEVKDFAAGSYVLTADSSGNSLETNGKIKFDSKAYTLADSVDLYVNGAFYAKINKNVAHNETIVGTTAGDSDKMIDKFLDNAQDTISLIKNDGDTGYSKILVSYYDTAKVSSVSYKNNTTTIQFTAANNAVTDLRKIIVNDDAIDDGDSDVYVTLGDNEIELKDLQKDDIIAFATDMATYKTSREVTDPDFLTVKVSRDTVTGKCTSYDPDEYTFKIDDKDYKMAQTWNPSYLTVRNTYKVYLDPFGRIYTADEDAASTDYAIVERLTDSENKVRLVLADGTVADYEFKNVTASYIKGLIYDSTGALKPVTDRVVDYTYKKSTNEITALNTVAGTAINAEFKANTSKLGSAIIADSTKVIDASDYAGKTGDYSTFAVSSFKDGVDYVGTYFKPSGATNASFIVLTTVGTKITSDSRFAVVKKTATTEDVDGDECFKVNVMADGEDKDLIFDTSFEADGTTIASLADLNAWLAQGDAFYYTLNSDGRVDNAYKVLDFTKYNKTSHVWSNTFNSAALTGAIKPADWNFNYYDDGSDIQLVYGIVTEVKSNAITFAQINSGRIDLNNSVTSTSDTVGTTTFGIANGAVGYDYDQFASGKEYDKIGTVAADGIRVSDIDQFETGTNTFIYDDATVASENINDYLTYALAMVVNGAVVEIYTFNN